MAEVLERFDVGLVFGKFYPLTKGHQYLIETARSRCRRLFVGISGRSQESIPQSTRANWIRRIYPDVVVVEQPQVLPYYPNECTSVHEFYEIWTKALQEVCGGHSPDALFTSEEYGEVMAEHLQCKHVMVDKERRAVPISATKVRQNPLGYWRFLDPIVRSYFVKVICVYGPESTGKSTLCEELARHFRTVWQPEWARAYLGDRHCIYEDMEIIARGHFGEHAKYRELANRVLFMDTDAITTLIYSEQYYRRTAQFVTDLANQMCRFVDYYLFTDIDVPWVPDTSRDLGEPRQRATMRAKYLAELDKRGLPYRIINGDWQQRLDLAIGAVNQILDKSAVV